jgi:hypothetical protein
VASRGRSESSESRNLSDFSLPSDSTAKSETLSDPKLIERDQQAPIDSGKSKSPNFSILQWVPPLFAL